MNLSQLRTQQLASSPPAGAPATEAEHVAADKAAFAASADLRAEFFDEGGYLAYQAGGRAGVFK